MHRNFWTILAVFASIFALAWFLNRAKTRALMEQRAALSAEPLPEGAGPSAAGSSNDEEAAETPTLDEHSDRASAADHAVAAPVADSINRNPPNGFLFAGRGKFQLYRQGDITWRLDTDTGQACILFATDEQWHTSRVFEHGCRGT
jgi:hypothetical protein